MMLRFSSGSLTPRRAVHTASVSVVSVVTPSSNANLCGPAARREPPHRAAASFGDAAVYPPRHAAYARDGESPGPPALPRQQLSELGNRVGAREHPAIGKHEVHRRCQRGERDPEAGYAALVLERDVAQPMFPV